jgi:23S rRNA-/tRNA-specific pseudouridylate synthase
MVVMISFWSLVVTTYGLVALLLLGIVVPTSALLPRADPPPKGRQQQQRDHHRYHATATSTIPSTSSSRIWAKPAPKTGFDLDAIEAFELELETLEQQQQQQQNTLPDGVDKSKSKSKETKDGKSTTVSLVVPESFHNKRMDAVLAALLQPELSRSVCGNLVATGRVKIITQSCATAATAAAQEDGQVMDRKSFKVETGMILQVTLPEEEPPTELIPQDIPLTILFEDEHMIVLNKAAHMVVHPAAGNWDGTIVNALAYYLPRSLYGRGDFVDQDGKPIITMVTTTSSSSSSDDDTMELEEEEDPLTTEDDSQSETTTILDESKTVSFRPGIVHRLDKGTTGVLVVAKTSRALTALSTAFAQRRVSKTYLAVTIGNPGNNVKIDKPIGRHPLHRQRMRVVPSRDQKNSHYRLAPPSKLVEDTRPPSQVGRRAVSYVDTLAFDGQLGLVRVKIETGRTHQVCQTMCFLFLIYLVETSVFLCWFD